MRQILLLFLAIPVLAATGGGRVEYVGGTAGVEAGTGGLVETQQPEAMVFTSRKATIRVPYSRINLIEYGQNASRRLVLAVVVSPMFLLAKSRRHFLTVGFEDESGKQQALVFRVNKSDVRALLASLEARTGLKVQFQDDEARKAGKG